MNVNFFLIFLFQIPFSYGFLEFIAPIGAGIVGVGYEAVCRFRECCSEHGIPANFDELERVLNTRVYGQHLVNEVVLGALRSHWNPNTQSPKALTISFHGWPGSGKNYVSQFIASSLYKEGTKSKFVHLFVGKLHFPRIDKVDQYQMNLYDWIKGNVSACPRQLFIFDEVDKMPPGVLNALKPIIDYHDRVDGVDYREAIFLFLSNTGAHMINNHFLDLWDTQGIKRKDLRMKHFESLITVGAFNEEGWWLENIIQRIVYRYLSPLIYIRRLLPGRGFLRSDTISSNLIDHFVPFLPMERQHVKLCILDEFKARNVSDPLQEEIDEALEFITWGPADKPIFSTTGCKRLSQKVSLIVSRRNRRYAAN